MVRIYPSLIAADLLNLQHEIEQLDPFVDGYHLDIMDNHFVPNLTWGPMFIDAIARITKRQIWVHLMVDNPKEWISKLSLPPKSILSFHFETKKEIAQTIKQIKEKNWLASIAINPKTPVDEIFPILNITDQVLLMSVEPGFSGQSFESSVLKKIDPLIGYRQTTQLDFSIGIDGGINSTNITQLYKSGIQDFAIATGIFGNQIPTKSIQELRDIATSS